MKALLEKIRKILRSRRTRQMMTRFVSGVAAVVVFVTTYALVLPAITLEQNASCGISEHQHTDACYEERLVCGLPEGQEHHHDASCYDKILICGQEVHVHSPECYQEDSSAVVSSGSAAAASTAFGAAAEPDVLYGTDGSENDQDGLVTDSYAAGEDSGEKGVEETAAEEFAAEESASDQAVGESGTENTAADGLDSGESDAGETDEKGDTAAGEYGTGEAAPEESAQDGSDSGIADTEGLKDSEDWNSAESKTSDTTDSNEAVNGSASDTSDSENEDAAAAGTEEAANAATTNVLPEPVETESLSSGYVPELDSIELGSVLNKHTDFYYFHPEQGQEIPDTSAEVTDWKKVKNGLFGSTELKSTDLVRMYLSYTIPAGALNETNQVVRYRLPSNIHLSDDQIIAINETENGMSALYADDASNTGEQAQDENQAEDENAAGYQKYLGAEAIEGTRRPDQNLKEGAQEYISAIVKAENVFDDEGIYGEKGAFLGQDLIFIFTPYSIEKNQITYNADGKPISAGEKITGWFACDFNVDQIDWVEQDTDLDNSTVEKAAEITFVEKDSENNIKEISRTLKLVDGPEDGSASAAGETADEAQTAASDETAAAAGTASAAETSAAAETAGTADTASEKASEDKAAGAEDKEDAEDGPFKAGTLTADGDGYKITLYYTEKAEIPENAELSVREITAETDKEAYEACLEQAGQQVAADEKTGVDRKASRFFDIEILVKDTDSEGKEETRKIEPAAPVSVNIQLIDDQSAKDSGSKDSKSEDSGSKDQKSSQSEPAVLHFAEEGVEQIDAEVKDSQEQKGDEDKNSGEESEPSGSATEISFEAESFSIYGVVYTVDFHWEVDGKKYDFSMPGGGFISLEELLGVLGIADSSIPDEVENSSEENPLVFREDLISEKTGLFVSNVKSVEFSNPELMWVGKIDESCTVGEIKKENGLKTRFSADMTKEQEAAFDAQTVEAGDWALISLLPFTSEETLTVTMNDGQVFTIKVTDDQPTTLEEIDGTKDYIIYYHDGDQYYALKTDGTTYTMTNREELKTLGSDCKWKVTYVYTDQESGMPYYLIRPSGKNYQTLTLNENDQPLVQTGSNQTMLVAYADGFMIGGYNNVFLSNDADGTIIGTNDLSQYFPTPMMFYDQSDVEHFQFAVRSNDFAMGRVEGKDTTGADKSAAEYDTVTSLNKKNQYSISAVPQSAKYMFNYWSLDGQRLPDQYGATIPAYGLDIPANGSTLEAHFKVDPSYTVPDDDKEGRIANTEELEAWLNELKNRTVPLDPNGCEKTAEVYDYENRVYRVDLTAKSSLTTFDGNVDLGLIMDASGSMQFPAKLAQLYYADGTTPVVYQLNHINDNTSNQNWLDKSKEYFIIADKAGTATVFRVYWSEWTETVWVPNPNGYGYTRQEVTRGAWRYVDASYDLSRSNEITAETRFSNDTVGVNYPIYVEAEGETKGKKRMDYLQSSVTGTIGELNEILDTISLAKNEGENPGVKVAWNTFFHRLNDSHHTFESVKGGVMPSNWATEGGTSTDYALDDAVNFEWETGSKKYAVLITDGAPQRSGKSVDSALVKAAADRLKAQGVTLITVGLSMSDVKRGSVLLYDIASTDEETGEPLFFKAEHGDELEAVMYEIIRKISQDATVIGDVTDTISDGFYPVDVKTGSRLMPGDWVNLKGEKVDSSDYEGPHGILGADGKTVTWTDQDFTHAGWHGTVYIKAKEDLIGANGLATNTGNTTVQAKKYWVEDKTKAVELKDADPTNPKYQIKKENIPTPLVNINELKLTMNSSEWTVYLGENVDPLEQLKKLYEEIDVIQVISENAATDEDQDAQNPTKYVDQSDPKLKETIPQAASKEDYVYTLKESILDNREKETGTRTDNATYKLKDLIKKLTGQEELDWETLISTGKIEIPYKVYNLDDDTKISFYLEQDVASGEKNLSESPHATEVTGAGVEKYLLRVVFEPDYKRAPYGQNEAGLPESEFHTGTYGTYGYMGHAVGKETSENEHTINVYASPLDVIKLDNAGSTIPGAVFKLYKPDPEGTEVDGLSGKYSVAAEGISDGNGIVHLITGTKDSYLVPDVEYMLVEESVPDGYVRDPNPKTVKVEKQADGVYTTLQGSPLSGKVYPFNWNQGAVLKVNGEVAEMYSRELPPAADVVVTGDDGNDDNDDPESGTTTGGSAQPPAEESEPEKIELAEGKTYPENSSLVSFRTKVENKINHTELDVTKKWVDSANRPVGESGYTASFVVKRWYMKNGNKIEEYVTLNADNLAVEAGQNNITLAQSEGKSVVTLTCTDGTWPVAHLQKLLIYAENNDQLTYTYEIEEIAHTSNDNTVTLDPVSYILTEGTPDRIDIVNKEKADIHINVKKKWKNTQGEQVDGADAPEDSITFDVYRRTHVAHVHIWGDPQDYHDATCTKEGSYTHTCLKCNESEPVTIPAKGHVPGEWQKVSESTIDGLRYVHQEQHCSDCGVMLDERTIRYACENGAHQFVEHEDTPAGCTTTGTGHYVCSVCGEPQPDSEYIIPATGHDWDEGELDHDPDCEHGATRTYTCKNDGSHTYSEAVPPLGHDWIEHRTEPTCHAEGSITYTCSRNETHTKDPVVLPRLEHQWNDGVVITPATATQKGTMRYTCLLCGDTRDEDIEKLKETFITDSGVDTGIVVEPFEWPIWKQGDPSGLFTNDATGIIKCTLANGEVVYGVIFRKFTLNVEQLTEGPGRGGAQNDSVRLTGKVFNSENAPIINKTISGVNKGDLYQTPDGKWYVRMKDGTANNIDGYDDLTWDDWYELPEAGVIGTSSSSTNNLAKAAVIPGPRKSLKYMVQAFVAPKRVDLVPFQDDIETAAEESKNGGQPAAKDADKDLTAEQKAEIATFLGIDQTAFMSRAESVEHNGAGTDVIEFVETVTIHKSDDNAAWKWRSGEYDYADEDGNVYTYFAVETFPNSGYDTTYSFSGETNKLKDQETETITNQQKEPPKVTITIQKQDAQAKTPLPEVTFMLTQVDEDGHNVPDGIIIEGVTSSETGKEGSLTFEDIVPGRYKLEETGIPAGYIASEGPYFINVVSGDGNDSVDNIATFNYIAVDGHTYTIGNEPGAALPDSGGPGTNMFYLLGITMIGLAGARLVMKRRYCRDTA